MATQLLFIYGTLLEQDNAFAIYLQQNSTVYAKAKIKGKLYDIGEYPGTVTDTNGEGFVFGSIVLLNDASVLKKIDIYEGYGVKQPKPNLFIRKKVQAETDTGIVKCWIYLYNLPVDGLHQIISGDYLNFIK